MLDKGAIEYHFGAKSPHLGTSTRTWDAFLPNPVAIFHKRPSQFQFIFAMALPQISIIGRPNVGKSSIFNWLAGRRLAIVDNMAGVTRDRMTFMLEHGNRYFDIIDTGGIGINDVDELDHEIEHQIEVAIQSADVLMFVVDARDGRTPLDVRVAERLRGVDKPVLLVANKCDGDNWEIEANEFFKLGFEKPICVSAKNNRHKGRMLDAMLEALPDQAEFDARDTADPEMKFALVGRRNVGKSTFINSLVKQERMIVSEVAGTTRDSVNVRFELDGKAMTAIDTPGLRRGKSVRTDIDFYGTHRAHRSIRYADVVLMMFDAGQRISKVDRQLVGYIEALINRVFSLLTSGTCWLNTWKPSVGLTTSTTTLRPCGMHRLRLLRG